MFLLISAFLTSAIAATPSTCDRNLSVSSLNKKQLEIFNQDKIVAIKNEKTDSGLVMIYTLKKIHASAELGMAMSTAFDEQSAHIRSLEKSNVLVSKPGYFRVDYEIILGTLIPNSRFISDTTLIRKTDGTLLQEWKLRTSTGLTKLNYADGYTKYIPVNANEAVMVYCTYNVPSLKIGTGIANSMAFSGTIESVEDTVAWIESVAKNKQDSERYIEAMLPFVVDSRM